MNKAVNDEKNTLKNEFINNWLDQAILLEKLFNQKDERIQLLKDIQEKDEKIKNLKDRMVKLSEKL